MLCRPPPISSLECCLLEVPSDRPGILIAEDEAGVRKLLQHALTRAGFCVYPAANGNEALEVYQQNRDSIRLVLLDIQMPELDGPWTLIALRKLTPDIRACFMTGHPNGYTIASLKALGASRVFRKPFNMPQLIDAIREELQA